MGVSAQARPGLQIQACLSFSRHVLSAVMKSASPAGKCLFIAVGLDDVKGLLSSSWRGRARVDVKVACSAHTLKEWVLRRSEPSRTALDFGENLSAVLLVPAPLSHELKPPENSAQFPISIFTRYWSCILTLIYTILMLSHELPSL